MDCNVTAVENHLDHARLFVQPKPIWTLHQIMHKVKGFTLHGLRIEFLHPSKFFLFPTT